VDFLHQFFDRGVPKKDKRPLVRHFAETAWGQVAIARSTTVKVRQTDDDCTQNSLALIPGG
jgi:hypothetical protein